jgi:hypothetical protein
MSLNSMTLMRPLPHSHGACLALILFFSGCENPGEQLKGFRSSKTEFPITRTLTDNTGRPLEATIIGRGMTSITVIRKSDGSRFDIPYDRLSAQDQAFVVKLPFHAAMPAAPGTNAAPSIPDNAERGILDFRRVKLRELDEQIRKNDNIIYQIGPTTMKGRSLRSENDRLIRERAELAGEVAELESR